VGFKFVAINLRINGARIAARKINLPRFLPVAAFCPAFAVLYATRRLIRAGLHTELCCFKGTS
jgi:hypothetical protein